VTPGTITEHRVRSDTLGYELAVSVYRPAGVPADDLPVLLFFDGHLMRTVLRVPTTLDNLIVAGRIAPMVAVLVHNFDGRRERELSPLPVLEKYAVDELLPWVRATFGAGRKGRNIAAGVSLGGLAATYLGLRRPDEFGRVVAHSGSFWWPRTEPGRLLREVARAGRSPVRFYLDVGTCETRSVGPGVPNQIEFCRAMRDALLAHGHTVTYAEYSGGHDYLNWRRTFADGLLSTA
jgi:enterochelin esterase family protein